MDRQEKRDARIFALKMAYAYEMTQNKNSLINDNINIDQDLNSKSEEVMSYSKKIVDICINKISSHKFCKLLIVVLDKNYSKYYNVSNLF